MSNRARIAGDYVHIYQSLGDVFPGPDEAELKAGRYYDEWIPNFHCFITYGPAPLRYAVSDDLDRWTPHGGLVGAPQGRDPNVLFWNDRYHLAVCGLHEVTMAVSRDLTSFTGERSILNMNHSIAPESPTLVRHAGTFYLFVCGWDGIWDGRELDGAYQHVTYVFQSDDPWQFDADRELTRLNAHAPEIFQDEQGDWYISSAQYPRRGVSLARLVWDTP